MSKGVLDSNIGDSEIDDVMDSIIAQNPQLNAQIETVRNENNAFLCKVLRIYPYDDKALVKILNNNRRVFCRLSHEVLGGRMSVDYLPNGVDKVDGNYFVGRQYVQPIDDLYGIMIKVRWLNLTDENVLLGYVNIHDSDDLRSSNDKGELSLKSGNSIISVTNERVNITTPSLFINGLPYDEPNLKNYYDKNESNMITESLQQTSVNKSELDDLLEEMFPIGHIYMNSNSNPPNLPGTWTLKRNMNLIEDGGSESDEKVYIFERTA